MRIFTKNEVDNMIMRENKLYHSFSKKNLILRESNGNAYVEPSSDGQTSLSNDLSTAQKNNPSDKNFIVNANSYDGDTKNNPITLDIEGDSPTDASNKFQNLTKNPSVRQLVANNNVNARIRLNNEEIEKLRASSIGFTKKEINEILKRKNS